MVPLESVIGAPDTLPANGNGHALPPEIIQQLSKTDAKKLESYTKKLSKFTEKMKEKHKPE